MINYRKYFNGGLNADDDFGLQQPGQWVNASNVRVMTTDTGATGRVEAIGGNKLLFNSLPSGQNYCIGGCADDAGQRLFFFNKNSNGEHGIYAYYKNTNTGYTVLLSSQVSGGLNFNKYIHSVVYIDGKLYWTEEGQEPRKINIEAGIKLNHPTFSTSEAAYTTPLDFSVITLLKKPPTYPLTAVKVIDVSADHPNNLIQNFAGKFAVRFLYRDNEYSVLNEHSLLTPYNTAAQTAAGYDAIDIQMPVSQFIEQDVIKVEFLVKKESDLRFNIIKTWDRGNTDDATEITNHNSNTTPLTYRFFNDQLGVQVDDITSTKQEEYIPHEAKTIELGKSRLFLGNNTFGYDVPKETSLTAEFIQTEDGTTTGEVKQLNFTHRVNGSVIPRYVIRITTISPYHYVQPPGTSDTYSDPVDFTTLTLVTDLFTYFGINPYDYNLFATTLGTPSVINTPTSGGLAGAAVYKSDAAYKIGVQFYDKLNRKFGVVENKVNYQTPDRVYSTAAYNSGLKWTLSNTNALTEIPEEAYSYSIVRTKCLRTGFFMQGKSNAVFYTTKNTDNQYEHTTTTYSNSRIGVSIDIRLLESYGMGYVYNEGDIVKVYLLSDAPGIYLRVIAVDGYWLVAELSDLGTLGTDPIIFEIFTPNLKTEVEQYYEVGNRYDIANPGTNTRAYTTTEDTLSGDVYILSRTGYLTEAMSFLDTYYKNWYTDAARICFIDTVGEINLDKNIVFSDVYLQGTQVNGLSYYSALNSESVDEENGSISKLVLANKIQIDGSVLLAICKNQTVSIYLGEQELFDTQSSAFVSKASSVIGSMKSLQGSMGTYNPESVTEHNGLVWFFDARNGFFVQYSNNGLDAISNNKFVRPTNLFAKAYASLTPEQIEAFGSRPYIVGGYDPYHKEVLFSIPKTGTPPKGYLKDYPEVIYPYDIHDNQGKTLIYKSKADFWIGSMSYEFEKFIKMNNELYSFKNGALYIQNQPEPAKFCGTQFKSRIMYANNPGAIHTYLSIGLEANKKPSWVHLRTEDPYVQSSDLILKEFINKEGVKYSSILRDRLSPNVTGTYVQKQMKGDQLFGKALLVLLEFEFTDVNTWDETFDETFGVYTPLQRNNQLPLDLRFSDIGNIVKKGHLFNHAAN